AHRLGAVLRRRAVHRPGHRGEQRGTQRPARGFGRQGIATSEAHGGSGGEVYRGRSGPAGRPTSRAGITWSVRTSRRASPPTCSTVHRVVVSEPSACTYQSLPSWSTRLPMTGGSGP